MRFLRSILVLCLLSFAVSSFGQGNALKADEAADNMTDVLNTESRLQGHSEIIVSTVQEVVTTAGNVMGRIYGIYKKILATTETVSDYISLAHEIRDAAEDVVEIVDMYDKYGVGIKFGSLYDMDRYLNPRQQADYMRQMLDILDQSATCLEWIRLIALGGKGGAVSSEQAKGFGLLGSEFEVKDVGGVKGMNLKLNDYWRLRMLRQFAHEIRELKFKMHNLVMNTMSLMVVNRQCQRSVVEADGIFDFSKYHYSSIGLFGLGKSSSVGSSSSAADLTQEHYERVLESVGRQDLTRSSILCMPRSELK